MDNDLKKRCEALAIRMYDLDTAVYEASGSSLGRTLIAPHDTAIEILTHQLMYRPMGEVITSDMALIGKMARSLRDRDQRKKLMSEYNKLMKELLTLSPQVVELDIMNAERVALNPFAAHGKRQFTSNDRLVICIGRSFCSGGGDIGFQLANMLHIDYYDATIFQDIIDRQQAEKLAEAKSKTLTEELQIAHERRGLRKFLAEFNINHGLPAEDAVFFNQSAYIEDLARKQDFVVMGRCADVVLKNARLPHVSIFITAPFDIRVRRCMELHHCKYREAVRMVKREDAKHARLYHRYTSYKWGDAIHYDLCVNSASYGIDESVSLILRVIKARVNEDLNSGRKPGTRAPQPAAKQSASKAESKSPVKSGPEKKQTNN